MNTKHPTEENEKLDFLVDKISPQQTETAEPLFERPTKKRHWGRRVTLVIALIIFFMSSFIYLQVSASPMEEGLSPFNFIKTIKHLMGNDERQVDGEAGDRINILVLGMGGEGHEGAYLTDTIIVGSFKPSTKQVGMVSIPRDLYVEIDGYGDRKVNHAFAYGETNGYEGGGAALASETISKIIGQPLPYYVTIDFSGFKKIIDDIGGVDIYVEQGFTDYQYPDYEYGIQTVSFTEGQHHLNGEQALEYARSRHGTNGQGSDFSRSKRQMQIIMAIKEKILSAGTLLNPSKMIDLYNNFTENIDTNMSPWEVLRFAQLTKGLRQSDIITEVIDNGPDGLLHSYISDTGAYVLTPRAGDFSEIHTLFTNLFASQKIIEERANITIYNGTTIPGLASSVSDKFNQNNFTLIDIGNAPTQDWQKTVIYDLTYGKKQSSLEYLKNILGSPVSNELPFDIQEKIITDLGGDDPLSRVDFVIVLGPEQSEN